MERVFLIKKIWCLYQKDRIEKIRRIISAVQNNDYVDNFNALTHDYNSRCGSYRYRENDLLTVQSELVLHDTELRSQASALVGQWADQSAKRSTSPPTITGQPLALGYPNASRSAANSAVQPDPERDAAGTRAPAAPTLDLLKVEDATEVQRRLAELGFYVGIPNGIWGARSRQALGEFKSENGLPRDDSWDIATNNKLLSSNVQKRDSGRTSTDLLGLTPAAETKYPPPIGAVRNPLNVEDAKIVQKILVELGFLTGTQDGVWGPVSRNALRDFKLKTGLAANDEWNAETERALENAAPKSDAIRIDETFIGGWAGEFSDCPNDSTGEAPLQITEHRAAIGDTVCNFAPPRREGSGWRTKAACIRPSRKPWNSNVKIEVAGDNLTWSSEGGTVKFVRCPGR
jgi:peptidoglycan hydrolase-like protein with peptidoglycan-binding domain